MEEGGPAHCDEGVVDSGYCFVKLRWVRKEEEGEGEGVRMKEGRRVDQPEMRGL
jgi:hypothetical protein